MRLIVDMRPGSSKGQSLKTEDGELIEGVKSVEWHADAAERPKIVVEFYAERVGFDLSEPTDIDTQEETHEQAD